jgi:hypothetical protein
MFNSLRLKAFQEVRFFPCGSGFPAAKIPLLGDRGWKAAPTRNIQEGIDFIGKLEVLFSVIPAVPGLLISGASS